MNEDVNIISVSRGRGDEGEKAFYGDVVFHLESGLIEKVIAEVAKFQDYVTCSLIASLNVFT